MEGWDLLNLDEDFKKYFPLYEFKLKEFQKQVIHNVVSKDNTLCIMPTGGGKSIIYWMSALEMKGITLVIAPLTALIVEQAMKIENHGYQTLVLHGGVSAKKQVESLIALANGEITPQFIFVSPEKIATDGFFEYCLKQRKDDIKLIVIDEVHCVSQWGMSFRPFYRQIPDFLNQLYGESDWARILALTATLNPKELQDICSAFKITRQNMLMRNEIQLHVQKFNNENEKEERFWKLLEMHGDEKILVYVYRKKGDRAVEGLCQEAVERGFKAAWFHGEMTAKERLDVIEEYRAGNVNVIFATNAFGMGIDIPDIRVVIHFMIPESAEQYYQEVGRAARDGLGANAYLLYSNKNIDVKKTYFIDHSFPSAAKLQETYKNVGKKEGYKAFDYFDNEDIQECLPYYVKSGLIKIVCKGFSGISELEDIEDDELLALYESTTSHGFVRTAKVNNLEPKALAEKVYSSLVGGAVKTKKPLERWLVIDVVSTEISEEQMQIMLADIEEKKNYKHELLDYFVYLLESNVNTQHLHQEIARYLGMDKYQLNRIYQTLDGNYVRSKSEVIISNLLYNAGINYQYEELLEYDSGKAINPDFTIYLENGKKLFWEHIGMLGYEEYDDNWTKKVEIYRTHFPGQLFKTYESGVLSKDAEKIIEEILKLNK